MTGTTRGHERAPDPRAELPGVSSLLQHPDLAGLAETEGHETLVAVIRDVINEARVTLAAGAPTPTSEQLVGDVVAHLDARETRRLRRVVNATGVLLHTNLGRAPLSDAAVTATIRAAGATNLEVDLETGERGGRGIVVEETLARLTGAEAALVVNNGAAALVLALAVTARGREVLISRGELVEIGGSFRLPDIIAAAGCVLREVGTTNRTHAEDYQRAIGPHTGAVLRVHPSNFSMQGFVHRPESSELGAVARAAGVPFLDDLGSGLLVASDHVEGEPIAVDAVRAGADLIAFSGDKLLGGPQAGILAGRAALVERCRRDPLARALRLDKLRMAALEATVVAHARGSTDELPLWAMARVPVGELRARAERIAGMCDGRVVETESALGGGSTPVARLPSFGVELPGPADPVARRLRTGTPPVVARIVHGHVVADLRSVPDAADDELAAALRDAVNRR